MDFKWNKKGLIFKKSDLPEWAKSSALQPTPILLDKVIRFYAGFRDEQGVSRVGYVEVRADDPTKIVSVSKNPVLDIGVDGAFDEFGVVPSVVKEMPNGDIFMYYAGYQLGKKVRFLVLSGLAISKDGGLTFNRYSSTPVFERNNDEMLFRVPHSLIIEDNKWKFWYGGGSHFRVGEHKTLPVYNVRYLESENGTNIPNNGKVIIDIEEDEYRIGRPYVIKYNGKYLMFYGYSTEKSPYLLGGALSDDGINWKRHDKFMGLPLSSDGWDSEMMAYPSVISYDNKLYYFYNGNNYGEDGFGYAELVVQ